ncbi:hypothetical protein HD598_002126 [Neomicrococcus aestuarii]|uniref:Uncharacterized protein n=1 Tax=Neomicrococcus aestuarii TaxID=556325 RepID=A0A7W8X225_9MICC|nr:hypothetical protein [Neomicrococcus aestuarii]MBB5513439.1 hypothetical protein [Neomicrococcus aestuarii]
MSEIDDDAHLSRWFAQIATCETANYIYAKDGTAYPVSGDALTTGRVEDRWIFSDD